MLQFPQTPRDDLIPDFKGPTQKNRCSPGSPQDVATPLSDVPALDRENPPSALAAF